MGLLKNYNNKKEDNCFYKIRNKRKPRNYNKKNQYYEK